jgi:hypothetical protein
MCADIDECEDTNVCSSDYPCTNTVPDYYCRGQFAEWPMPDHVAGAATVPSYAAGDDTVTDNVTHLVWQNNVPATYPACSGTFAMSGDTCTWEEAKAYCASQELSTSLGGTGWRLPTKIELESLVDRTRSNPAIDPTFATLAGPYMYWTASPHVGVSGNVHFVDFSSGATGSFPTSNSYRVRCVASVISTLAASPPGHYSAAQKRVKDNRTGLTWQEPVDSGTYTWDDAKKYCQELQFDGAGWRLPTCNELLTLVDPTEGSPKATIDSTAFPNTPPTYFWSASPLVGLSGHAWFVNFNYGSANRIETTTPYRVRCVR